MKSLKVEMISPGGLVYSGEAEAVLLPGTTGSFSILYNHAPLVSMLATGALKITPMANAAPLMYKVSGGVVEVSKNTVSVLVEKVVSQG